MLQNGFQTIVEKETIHASATLWQRLLAYVLVLAASGGYWSGKYIGKQDIANLPASPAAAR